MKHKYLLLLFVITNFAGSIIGMELKSRAMLLASINTLPQEISDHIDQYGVKLTPMWYRAKLLPDGNLVVPKLTYTKMKDGQFSIINVWNAQGQKLATLPHNDDVYSAQFNNNGSQIITQTCANLYIWSTAGDKLATLSLHGKHWMNSAEVSISSRVAEGEGELFVCVEHFGLERLRIIRADYRVRDIVTIGPSHRGPNRHR